MGMVKNYMMGVQEEAADAYERLDTENPYVGTMWERCWQEAWDGHADAYGEYLDGLQAEEDYLRSPFPITYFDYDGSDK